MRLSKCVIYLALLTLQFIFADPPDWQDDPGSYEFVSTIAGAIVLNDGVQITAAPLWKLFQHKPWQKVLKETWGKLEKGDYDWAHLAYSYWPERVKDKCRTDKSLAIAHGLEDLYES